MGRLLLFAAIAAVAWYLFRRLANPPAGVGQPPAPQSPQQAPVTRCAECGVHAPENAGVRYQNLYFCCPEHLNDYVRKLGSK